MIEMARPVTPAFSINELMNSPTVSGDKVVESSLSTSWSLVNAGTAVSILTRSSTLKYRNAAVSRRAPAANETK